MTASARFGLSTHLFHSARLERDHLARMADAGFSVVEVFATQTHFDYHDVRQIDTVRGWLESLGMHAWSVHLPITDGIRGDVWGRPISIASKDAARTTEALRETTAAVAAAGVLGASVAVLHLGVPADPSVPPDDNDEGAVRRILEPISLACDQAGVRLALEVVPNPLSTAPAVVDWLRADLDLGQTGACLDVGHAHMTGGVVEAVEVLGGHIITTHIHDNAGRKDDHLHPFEGTIDWPSALFALAKVGYDGPLIFEVPDHGDAIRTLTGATRARGRIQAILNELATPFPFEDE